MAIIRASTVIFRCIILFRINHFGMNPVIGGNPPKERTVIESRSIMVGELDHIIPMSFIVVNDVRFMVRKIGIVVVMYSANVRSEIFGAMVSVAKIQPVWAIDENAMSFRSWVWLRPPRPPIVIDRMADVSKSVMLVLLLVYNRIVSGAIFCHVRIVRVVRVVVPCDTSGSQKWNGAAAIFIIRAKVMIVVVGSVVRCISQLEVFRAFIVAANSIVVEAMVCVK